MGVAAKTVRVLEQPLLRDTQLPVTHFSRSPSTVTMAEQADASMAQAVAVTSLAGTSPDGAVNIDAHGNVLIDQDLHRLFDYCLTAVGELSPEQIRHQLLTTASDFLSLSQLEQLRDHFDNYLEYLQAADHMALSSLPSDDLATQLEAIKKLRRDYLGSAMADAFFAEEEAYAGYAMSGQLSEVEASDAVKLKWLQAEEQATAFHDVLLENQLFNEVALAASDRLTVRAETYGTEVALKLAALDAQQQLWQAEVDQYLTTRLELAHDAVLLAAYEEAIEPRKLRRLQAHYRAEFN